MRRLIVIATTALPQLAAAEGAPPLPKIEVYCTGSSGERYELGEVICITASCQTWMARCDMSLNSPMWRKMQDGCPAVSLEQRLRQVGRG